MVTAESLASLKHPTQTLLEKVPRTKCKCLNVSVVLRYFYDSTAQRIYLNRQRQRRRTLLRHSGILHYPWTWTREKDGGLRHL